MECITEKTVERTWQAIAQMAPDAAASEMMSFASDQPHLLGFVTAFLDDLQDDAREMGTYLLFVVYKMFENSTNDKIPRMQPETIIAQYEANQEFLLSADMDDDTSMEEMAAPESSKQPWVFQYVTDALLEEDDDDVPEDRSLYRFGFCLL